jgi:hypothetical protein
MLVSRPQLCSLGIKPTRPLVSALILGLALSATALGQTAHAVQTQAPSPAPDLGDAPASTNNFGIGMQWTSASPATAQFPTVFTGVLPTGPKHFNSPTLFHLGNANVGGTITAEGQADSGADADGVNNIRPAANTADQDKADDGPDWTTLGSITGCQTKQYRYFVTVLPGAPTTAYVNSWYDFNQSGRWGDVFTCGSLNVDEWIVKNQVVNFPGPGVYVFSTPLFSAAANPSPYGRWARISLSETPLPNTTPSRLGSGPASGWKYGETEDYRLSN